MSRCTPILHRFATKVEVGKSCWLWMGSLGVKNGYGRIGRGGKNSPILYAHRVSYELFIGTIPEGYHIDHLCRNRACVNPRHLEAVTQAENNRRANHLRFHGTALVDVPDTGK